MAHVWTLSRFLMRISSFFSSLIESAIAIETHRGSPSGMATIMITTAIIAILPSPSIVLLPNKFYSEVRITPVINISYVTTLKNVANMAYLVI
jgi:hypothetical protein